MEEVLEHVLDDDDEMTNGWDQLEEVEERPDGPRVEQDEANVENEGGFRPV